MKNYKKKFLILILTASVGLVFLNINKVKANDNENQIFTKIDYEALENAITEKTKVIIPIDIAGTMCDYDRLYEIVERKKHLFKPNNDIQKAYGRIIISADAAHSLGSTYKLIFWD